MSIIYTINNKVLKNSANDKWLIKKAVDPLNPLDLPSNTIRVKYQSGSFPYIGDSQTRVDYINNIWDIYKESNDWTNLFENENNLLEVLGANTTNVTNMYGMFQNCESLTSFSLFNTSNVTSMDFMFYDCMNVVSGALALYKQASTQSIPPSSHSIAFTNCGLNTPQGAAELAQIPNGWK